MSGERFAVFAFAGETAEPPYSVVMFFADRPRLGMFVVRPRRITCARGLADRFEIEFPDPRLPE